MHLNSRLIFEKHAKHLFKSGMRVLEVGPGHPSEYKLIVGDDSVKWEGVDLFASEHLTYLAESEYVFPIESDTFDIVFSAQVIEHVRKIWVWMKELSRVCKRGGRVITINPVSWPYHEAPIDCWRMFPEGMKALYEDAGLTMELSTFESLEPPHSTPYLLKQVIKPYLGREPVVHTVVDTISIGVKQ